MEEKAFTYVVVDKCPVCGKRMVLRTRRKDGNPFAACSGYPRCNFAGDLAEDPAGYVAPDLEWLEDELKSMILAFHPDLNSEGLDANSVVARLNVMRSMLRGKN